MRFVVPNAYPAQAPRKVIESPYIPFTLAFDNGRVSRYNDYRRIDDAQVPGGLEAANAEPI